MNTKQEYQVLHKVLIDVLKTLQERIILKFEYDYESNAYQSSLDYFKKQVKQQLKDGSVNKDVIDQFLETVYNNVFHTGDVPKNCNHILMTCCLKNCDDDSFHQIQYWIDLDKVNELMNTHFKIQPPYRFKVDYYSQEGREFPLKSGTQKHSYYINSIDPDTLETIRKKNDFWKGVSIFFAGISICLLIIALEAFYFGWPGFVPLASAFVIFALLSCVFYNFRNTHFYTHLNSVVQSEPVQLHEILHHEMFREHHENELMAKEDSRLKGMSI